MQLNKIMTVHMSRLILLFVSILFILNNGLAQPCLPDGITFSTQSQIDSFQIIYPNCHEIEGGVIIQGEDISNLNGLNTVNKIEGGLLIHDPFIGNSQLTDLEGLNNLNSIGEFLIIASNSMLANLNGLENLESVNGYIQILWNNSLTNIANINSLTTVGEFIGIGENNSLENISGFNNLVTIGGLYIEDNPVLKSISGLSILQEISGKFWIIGDKELLSISGFSKLNQIEEDFSIILCDSLSSVGDFDSLNYIGGDLTIDRINSLTTLTWLKNVISIGGKLKVQNNNSLTSLSGLENIEAGSISNLSIYNNPALSGCNIQSVCEYLSDPNGYINIYQNSTGCNSQIEVQETCDTVGVESFHKESLLLLHPNPAKNEVFITSKNGLLIDKINFYNNVGQKVFSVKLIKDKIDISQLKQGIYFIEIETSQSIVRRKLIIE